MNDEKFRKSNSYRAYRENAIEIKLFFKIKIGLPTKIVIYIYLRRYISYIQPIYRYVVIKCTYSIVLHKL